MSLDKVPDGSLDRVASKLEAEEAYFNYIQADDHGIPW